MFLVLLIGMAGTGYAIHSLRQHEANNDTEYDGEWLRAWRIAAIAGLVFQIAVAVWLASRGDLF